VHAGNEIALEFVPLPADAALSVPDNATRAYPVYAASVPGVPAVEALVVKAMYVVGIVYAVRPL
jgi:hypothetical protein